MTSYLTSMETISLSRTTFEIFDFKVFRVWPWPPTSEGHLGSKIFILFENLYMTSYLTSMNTISLSRTVLEIFDFKVFRVWPWPLTSGSHLRSKSFIPCKSSCMTSFLTSMNTISLSRAVFEIFDSEVFRVWPWPLTSEGRLIENFLYHSKAHIWLPIQLSWTLSLSRAAFEIFDFKVFKVWLWPFTSESHMGSKYFIPFESPFFVLQATWNSSSKPLLKHSHWLPVQQRITYKIALITFSAQTFEQPSYLHSLLDNYTPSRNLRWEGQHLLRIPFR